MYLMGSKFSYIFVHLLAAWSPRTKYELCIYFDKVLDSLRIAIPSYVASLSFCGALPFNFSPYPNLCPSFPPADNEAWADDDEEGEWEWEEDEDADEEVAQVRQKMPISIISVYLCTFTK